MQTARRPASARRAQRGTTLIEASAVAAVVAVVAGLVAPGMQATKVRQQLAGAAAEFETDVQYARSTAVLGNQPVRLSFPARNAPSACYVIHTGAAGECSCAADGSPQCSADAVPLRSASFAAAGMPQLTSNARSIVFDPVKGTSTPAGTVRFTAHDGKELRQVINIMGRVRTCTPGGALHGYKAC